MDQAVRDSSREALIAELAKMKRLGFFVVDEAFDVAASMNACEIAGLSVSAAALIVKERGYAKYRSKVRVPLNEK
jgi:hypothetical protein